MPIQRRFYQCWASNSNGVLTKEMTVAGSSGSWWRCPSDICKHTKEGRSRGDLTNDCQSDLLSHSR
jgi:hypothetical protein